MVGVSLVTGISVLAASVKSSVRSILGEQFVGSYVINTSTQGFGGLPPDLAGAPVRGRRVALRQRSDMLERPRSIHRLEMHQFHLM